MRSVLVVASVLAVALTGCMAGETVDDGADDAAVGALAADPALASVGSVRLEAKDCRQGGGNSVYPMEQGTMVGPFEAADQRAEVGNPLIGAYGMPVTGPSNGIWHVATVCESYTYNGEEKQGFGMGWIAQMIERPAYDVWGEPRIQFIVADLSFNDETFVQDLKQAASGAEISPAFQTVVEWPVPGSAMHVVIEEANHGTFDFTAEIHKEFAQKQDEHIRFWMLPPVGGGHDHGHDHDQGPGRSEGAGADPDEPVFRPITIDIYDTLRDGPTPRVAGESAGTFTHVSDEEQHIGNPLGHYQDGFDRVIEIGPVPQDITYDVTWLH